MDAGARRGRRERERESKGGREIIEGEETDKELRELKMGSLLP